MTKNLHKISLTNVELKKYIILIKKTYKEIIHDIIYNQNNPNNKRPSFYLNDTRNVIKNYYSLSNFKHYNELNSILKHL